MPKKKTNRIEMDKVGKPAEVIARLEALETEEKNRNPDYKVPKIEPVSR